MGDHGLLVIWGGGDISPSLYSQYPGSYTRASKHLSRQDKVELSLALAAMERGIPIVGVCRGAQLMCVLAGGKLIQHVSSHGCAHLIDTNDNYSLVTSSIHHQMMFPWGLEHDLLAWCEARSSVHLGENDEEVDFPEEAYKEGNLVEPEVVWFPKIKALAIQGHPEFMQKGDSFVKYSLEKTTKLCLN